MRTVSTGLLLAALCGANYHAQGTPDGLGKEILHAMRQSAESQASCKIDAWRALHTKDWVITFPNGQQATAAEFLKECKPVRPTIYEDARVRIYEDDTAIVDAQFRLNRPDGSSGALNRISQVWVKQNGTWLNANSHVTTIQKPGA